MMALIRLLIPVRKKRGDASMAHVAVVDVVQHAPLISSAQLMTNARGGYVLMECAQRFPYAPVTTLVYMQRA
jgi:hypothetical protein